MLRYFQGKGGWVNLPPQVTALRAYLTIESYVELYDNPAKIGICVALAFVDQETLNAACDEFEQLPTPASEGTVQRPPCILAAEPSTIRRGARRNPAL